MFSRKIFLILLLSSLPIKSFCSDGQINFYGSIVNPPCVLNTTIENNIDAKCYREKEQKMISSYYNLKNDMNIDGRYKLSNKVISGKNNNRIATVTIEYN